MTNDNTCTISPNAPFDDGDFGPNWPATTSSSGFLEAINTIRMRGGGKIRVKAGTYNTNVTIGDVNGGYPLEIEFEQGVSIVAAASMTSVLDFENFGIYQGAYSALTQLRIKGFPTIVCNGQSLTQAVYVSDVWFSEIDLKIKQVPSSVIGFHLDTKNVGSYYNKFNLFITPAYSSSGSTGFFLDSHSTHNTNNNEIFCIAVGMGTGYKDVQGNGATQQQNKIMPGSDFSECGIGLDISSIVELDSVLSENCTTYNLKLETTGKTLEINCTIPGSSPGIAIVGSGSRMAVNQNGYLQWQDASTNFLIEKSGSSLAVHDNVTGQDSVKLQSQTSNGGAVFLKDQNGNERARMETGSTGATGAIKLWGQDGVFHWVYFNSSGVLTSSTSEPT